MLFVTSFLKGKGKGLDRPYDDTNYQSQHIQMFHPNVRCSTQSIRVTA